MHNRKVVVRSYQLCKHNNLVFPVVFDGSHEHLAHPLELKKIPLGLLTKVAHGGNPQDRTFAQINIFSEDNTDPDEPPEPEEPPITSDQHGHPTKGRPSGSTVANQVRHPCPPSIDPEFKNLLPPLTDEEFDQLEKNLIRGGSPIITLWKGHNIIIDGHHTHEICLKHNIPFTTREIELAERSDVINWMFDLQLGRRNLTEKEKSYYRAKQYNSLKQERGGDRRSRLAKRDRKSEKSKGQSDPLKKSTAQIVGEKTGVSEKTIKRDVKYSEAVDEIADKTGISSQEVLNSELSKKQVQEVSAQSPEVIKQKLANPKYEKPRELPKLKIGQLVQIRSDRTNKDLVGYNKSYAVVKKLKRTCADIDVWGKLLTDVHLQFLYPVEDKVAICANVSPEFLIRVMENYKSFDSAVEHIPINKYRQGEKVRIVSSYRKNEIMTITQVIGSTKSNVMFADGTVEIFENRNLSSFVDS